jgi:DNA-binding GntR family transcriptional regulator
MLAVAIAYPTRDVAAEHAAIAAAALDRDAARAAELLARHLAATGDFVQRGLVDGRPGKTPQQGRRAATARSDDTTGR